MVEWSSSGEPATRIALVRAAYGAATALGQTGREIRSDSSCSSWEQVYSLRMGIEPIVVCLANRCLYRLASV